MTNSISCRSLRLGINIDHLATLRQQRHTSYPDLIQCVKLAQSEGVEQITLHLREDRRHIQDEDVIRLRPIINEMNLEMAATEEMLDIALKVHPDWVCLVPERRQEITTEGGLALNVMESMLKPFMARFRQAGINASLFIDASAEQVASAHRLGAQAVEFNTGAYADWWTNEVHQTGMAPNATKIEKKLLPLMNAAKQAQELGIFAHAGHGLNVSNVGAIAKIPEIRELNIGHAIVCDAVIMGWVEAIRAMRQAMNCVRC